MRQYLCFVFFTTTISGGCAFALNRAQVEDKLAAALVLAGDDSLRAVGTEEVVAAGPEIGRAHV